ncbi:MAG: hypothetical protein ACREXP_13630 [Steroidobacteraceae bacterium]
MRNLSEQPLRAAALAPLIAPVVVAGFAALGDTRSVVAGLDSLVQSLPLVWLVAYAYMWIIALPLLLAGRRWIKWSWPALIILGAVLGGLPWFLVVLLEPAGGEPSWSRIAGGERVWVLFAACGAAVAATFCLLQAYFLGKAEPTPTAERP